MEGAIVMLHASTALMAGWAATVEIADPTEALTFARHRTADGLRVIAVRRYVAGAVTGVDLATAFAREASDPLTLLEAVGQDAIRTMLARPDAPTVTIDASTLITPLELTAHHVAAGTNYPEHAGEAEVEDGPFLFPKLVTPTDPTAQVAIGGGLLDYEVELAWVPLAPWREGARPSEVGLILCNDYTDRATLLRHVDPWNPTSGVGFTTGKSAPGFLPVGNLFVVPRDPRAFARNLDLQLAVNGTLRQHSRVDAQIWDLDAMLAETWARRQVTWEHRGANVSLLAPDGSIPARTLLMSGTPGGTIFAGVDRWTTLMGLYHWLTQWGRIPITTAVIETYIARATADHRYLQPSDDVTIHVERLGVIRNAIVP